MSERVCWSCIEIEHFRSFGFREAYIAARLGWAGGERAVFDHVTRCRRRQENSAA